MAAGEAMSGLHRYGMRSYVFRLYLPLPLLTLRYAQGRQKRGMKSSVESNE